MPEELNQIQPVYSDSDTDLGRSEPAALGIDYVYYLASPFFAGFKTFDSSEWKIFLASFYSLSPNIKDFIAAPETSQAIFKIGTDNGLEDNQIYRTSELMRDFLLGKIFIKDLPSQLMQKINIDEAKSAKIINEIVSQLFSPIIEDVKRIQRSKFPDKVSQLQKESQPTTMTQPTARPDSSQAARPLSPRPEVQSRPLSEVQSQAPQQTKPVIPSQPQAVRPPTPQAPPRQNLEVRPPYLEAKLPSIQLQRPPVEVRPPQPAPIVRQAPLQTPQPPIQPPSRPQFKVPNMSNDLSGIRVAPSTPAGKAEESLEKELEKVANVIDLRNKPNE